MEHTNHKFPAATATGVPCEVKSTVAIGTESGCWNEDITIILEVSGCLKQASQILWVFNFMTWLDSDVDVLILLPSSVYIVPLIWLGKTILGACTYINFVL